MSVATMTSKGQVTIPVDIRRDLGLEPGAKLRFVPLADDSAIVRMQRSTMADLYGSLRRPGQAPVDDKLALGLALDEDDQRIKRGFREEAA